MISLGDFQNPALPDDQKCTPPPPHGSYEFFDIGYQQQNPVAPQFFPHFPYPTSYHSLYPPVPPMPFMTPQTYPPQPLPGATSSVFSSPESLAESSSDTTPQQPSYSTPAPAGNNGITVEVWDSKLWKQFDAAGNEMVLTKNGRNPFPKFHLRITGLSPNEHYKVAISFERSDDKRYKFNDGAMESMGIGEPVQASDKVFHPDGTISGLQWMQGPVKFDKLKISNTLNDPSKPCIKLCSMHKYHAVIHVFWVDNFDTATVPHMYRDRLVASVEVPHTTFVTVTAYQKQDLVKLKVENNNYARGFRKDGKHTKRKNSEFLDDPNPAKKLNDSVDSGISISPPQTSQWPMTSMPAMPYPMVYGANPYSMPMPGMGMWPPQHPPM